MQMGGQVECNYPTSSGDCFVFNPIAKHRLQDIWNYDGVVFCLKIQNGHNITCRPIAVDDSFAQKHRLRVHVAG